MRNMNAHNNSLPEPNDDSRLEELLAPLKHLEPPLEARIANRQAVSAALCSLQAVNRQSQLPWWRRSVVIPVPLAAALSLVMAVALYASFRNWQEQPALVVATPAQPTKAMAAAGGNETVVAMPTADAHPTWKHYETETYLCGVGRVNSESYYVLKE
jgi:hypothetical protein